MCRPTPKRNFTKCLPIIILFFTALRILAGLRIPYMILADQRYDDRMLFENAYDLLSGVWLGSYDAYTLAKGIGYPMFLVLAKNYVCPIPCCWLYCRLWVPGCSSAHYLSDGRIPTDRRSCICFCYFLPSV